jgi:hypothetical protein
MNCRNCKRLREFEEIASQGKAVEVTVNNKEETFVWISSKNWASGLAMPIERVRAH